MLTAYDTGPYVIGALGVGGLGAWLSRRREMILRWCTWAVTAPLVGGALYLGAPGAAMLAAGIAVGCAIEYGRLVRLPFADRGVLAVAVGALPFIAWLAPSALSRAFMVALVAIAACSLTQRDGLRRLAFTALGAVWLAAPAGLVLLGPAAFPVFFAVSIVDVAAFCGGKLLRGPFLSPLSPAKRWSGVLIGAVAGIATLAVSGALTPALAVAVVVGAPLGDLIESQVKRGVGVKDAGCWLPGFGGLLDRVDSLLVTLVLALVLA
jgi:phosphatidate cytidylyltransferase